MKKVIALILVTLMVTTPLAGCSSSSEVAELRQEVENLQSELSQLKEQLSKTQSTALDAELLETSTETFESENLETKPSDTTIPNVTSDMLDYLTTQLQSNYYEDWNDVATCDYATEEHLLKVARKCATIEGGSYEESWATSIATSICTNPATTGAVIKELSNSIWYAVWNIAAESTYADEEALIAIARKCATIQGNSSKESWATSIATTICENHAVTNRVLKELANSNFTIVTSIAHEELEKMQ